jgi:hypothetical protein
MENTRLTLGLIHLVLCTSDVYAPWLGYLKKNVFKFQTLHSKLRFGTPHGQFFAYAEPLFYREVNQERTPQPNREDDMEVVFIILSLAGLALGLKQSAQEEKRYKTQMAECRNRLLYQLDRCRSD